MHPSDHRKITGFALSVYRKLPGSDAKSRFHANDGDIIDGTDYEDQPFHGMGLKRMFNWHFYSDSDSGHLRPFPLYGFIRIYPSSRRIFGIHSGNFEKMISAKKTEKDAMILLGRIIHHIQDMSTPAHVVPVYHGPTMMPKKFPSATDHYEEFSSKNIDTYLNQTVMGNIPVLKAGMDDSFMKIYDDAARTTLEYLNGDDSKFPAYREGEKISVGSDLFWKKYKEGEGVKTRTTGFGSYGIFENRYGDNSITDRYDGAEITIRIEDYISIYVYCLKKMVSDTIRCLQLVERMQLY